MEGLDKKQWHPHLIGKIPGYPLTIVDFLERRDRGRAHIAKMKEKGTFTRKGVPDGWGRRKAELKILKARAAAEAKELVKELMATGHIEQTDDPRAVQALEANVEMLCLKTDEGEYVYDAKVRLAASKTLLEYLKAKPTQKVEATVNKAEDFLAALAAKP